MNPCFVNPLFFLGWLLKREEKNWGPQRRLKLKHKSWLIHFSVRYPRLVEELNETVVDISVGLMHTVAVTKAGEYIPAFSPCPLAIPPSPANFLLPLPFSPPLAISSSLHILYKRGKCYLCLRKTRPKNREVLSLGRGRGEDLGNSQKSKCLTWGDIPKRWV